MTESEILTLNERVKAISTYCANLSAALLAATAARVWIKAAVDLNALAWLAVTVGLILISWQVLHLLEPASEDGP